MGVDLHCMAVCAYSDIHQFTTCAPYSIEYSNRRSGEDSGAFSMADDLSLILLNLKIYPKYFKPQRLHVSQAIQKRKLRNKKDD